MKIFTKLSATLFAFLCFFLIQSCGQQSDSVEFHVTFPKSLSPVPHTGRLFVFLGQDLEADPIFNEKVFFAKDVEDWMPGETAVLDGGTMGFPFTLRDLPAGRYAVRALLDKNEREWGFLEAAGNLFNEKTVLDISAEIWSLTLDRSVPEKSFKETDSLKEIIVPSQILSRFHGRSIDMEAAVILPPSYSIHEERKYPVVYIFPGYGGWHFFIAEGDWEQKRYAMNTIGLEKIFVYVDHDCSLGYHCFVDSTNNGPVGQAFIEEFIPFFERRYRVLPGSSGRLLAGQSSGAWASLWLQVNYPDFFGGAWAVSPDPVDFRSFLGVNLYAPDTGVFFDLDGQLRPLIIAGGKTVLTWKDRVRMERILGPGGWLGTFEAQFSPKDKDGNPAALWNRETGKLDPLIVEHWKRYDLRLFILKNWAALESRINGKLHIFVADDDDARLDDPVLLFKESLIELGCDAHIKILSTGGHGDGVWKQVIGEIHSQMDSSILTGRRVN